MQRREVIKKFLSILNKDDFVVFIGEGLCNEAYLFDKNTYLYLFDYYYLSVAIGIATALPNDKRVFIVFDDLAIANDVGSIFQIFLNSNSNIFLFFLTDINGFFKQKAHVQGIFFNFGLQSFNITSYFSSPASIKNLRGFISNAPGPKIYITTVEVSNRTKIAKIDKDAIFLKNRFNFELNKIVGESINGV